MTALGLAVCLLTVAVVLDLVLTLGLARRLRSTLRAAGIDETPAEQAMPQTGTKIGPFSVSLLNGTEVNANDLSSRVVEAAFLTAGCGPCARVTQQLVARGPADRPLMTFIVGSERDPASQDVAKDLMPVTTDVAIVDVDSTVVKAFDVRAYPTLIVLDDGVVKRAGWQIDAIDTMRAD
jgi:thiol-disulfide isomerase/thioredoxin